jgi:hypothetical protein
MVNIINNSEQNHMNNGMMSENDSDEDNNDDDLEGYNLMDLLSNVKSFNIGKIEITHKKDD